MDRTRLCAEARSYPRYVVVEELDTQPTYSRAAGSTKLAANTTRGRRNYERSLVIQRFPKRYRVWIKSKARSVSEFLEHSTKKKVNVLKERKERTHVTVSRTKSQSLERVTYVKSSSPPTPSRTDALRGRYLCHINDK